MVGPDREPVDHLAAFRVFDSPLVAYWDLEGAFAYPCADPYLDDAVACDVLVVAVLVDLGDQVVLGPVDHSCAGVALLVHPVVVVVVLAVRVVVARHAVVAHVTLVEHCLVHHHYPAAVVHADPVGLARVAVVDHVALHHVVQAALYRAVDVVVARVAAHAA